MIIGVCHMVFTGTELLDVQGSMIAQIDDGDLPSLRAAGTPRGYFPEVVDVAAIRRDVERLRTTRWRAGRVVPPVCLLNFERCDGWENAGPYIDALMEILKEGDGFTAVYLYGYHGERHYQAERLDGRIVPMNAERDVIPPNPRIIPMLHPIEWGPESTGLRMRQLTKMGHSSVVIWTVSRPYPPHETPARSLLLAKLEGYWTACVDLHAIAKE